MKAAVTHNFGDVGVLRYGGIETPTPGPGHILIEVPAAGVNRLDHCLREGTVTKDISMPHILGSDASVPALIVLPAGSSCHPFNGLWDHHPHRSRHGQGDECD